MNIVLFVLVLSVKGKVQNNIFCLPLEKYQPIARHPYEEGGDSIPITGHAVAFDAEGVKGIFSTTTVYPGSGHCILPELGAKNRLGDYDTTVKGFRVNIVPEGELERKVPLDKVPVMHPARLQ